jgi:hypothetical protein
MAVVTGKVNNLSGFPFNDWKNLKKYTSLEPKIKGSGDYNPIIFGKKGLIKDGKPAVEVVYFKKAHPGLFLWDLRKLKRETSR